MFKRVERRIKRKEREDELGLDEDMKDVLGLNDTDSDESESDVDSEDRPADEDTDQDIEVEEEYDDNSNDEMEGDFDQESDGDSDDDKSERSLIRVEEALKNPIFIVSLDPDIKECIVCPGKLLKGLVMVEAHKSSNAHERRFKQFKKLAADVDPRAKAHELVLRAIGEKKPEPSSAPSGTSKRAEKRHIAKEKRKAKREKYKARQKAKKDSSLRTEETNVSKEDEKPAKEKGKPPGKKVPKKKSVEDLPSEKRSKPNKSQQIGDTIDTKTSKKRDTPESTEPPKKKRKTTTSIILETNPSLAKKRARPMPPTVKKPKSNLKPTSEPSNESPEVIQDLQAQVNDIIKSASKLAKAARARALTGDANETKPLSAKKRKATSGASAEKKTQAKAGLQKT